ncbi:recombinase family protein [Flavobacteriaceae bacterium]|jgi:DNA invertase Pin-like site-specific DNA recombinase|nr:recombinase family protein [Flavobacteriaceae bacterium]MDB2366288.1 recombinase family protein [Flavobacteriaceae bacterium]MDB3873933.1 recombinase family protein [Flavobacteriaceae bacterium]MDB4595849.1 recombinase family protein [Flavobacteriaceae bacterium]MDC0879013.1 recombinase family protein [Flavobacteriaceae bacterium]|tara:strand:- start:2162 stop:2767 length:606 start_codon:yes stop_codon:yes gene_type:complete
MIISYFQTTDNSEAQKFLNKENVYLDLCSSVIPFTKREKGSLVFALINQKQISKVVVPNISVLGRNQIDVLNTIDFFINNDISLLSQAERLETMDEYGRIKPDTILFLNLFRSLANMEYKNRKESHRYGIQQAKDLGRYKGVGGRQLDSIEDFFAKPININILRHLKRGESIRRIAKLVGSSPGLVQKVKRWAIDHNKLEN